MHQHERIIIIGHPGSGKTLIAKALAEKLKWKVVDADFGLEFHMGKTLTDIVGKEGAAAFQECNAEILIDQLAEEKLIIVTDPATILSKKIRSLFSSEFVVYLKTNVPIQLERTSRNPVSILPLDDREAFFNKLHQERDPLYQETSDFSINTDNHVVEDCVEHILSAFNK